VNYFFSLRPHDFLNHILRLAQFDPSVSSWWISEADVVANKIHFSQCLYGRKSWGRLTRSGRSHCCLAQTEAQERAADQLLNKGNRRRREKESSQKLLLLLCVPAPPQLLISRIFAPTPRDVIRAKNDRTNGRGRRRQRPKKEAE